MDIIQTWKTAGKCPVLSSKIKLENLVARRLIKKFQVHHFFLLWIFVFTWMSDWISPFNNFIIIVVMIKRPNINRKYEWEEARLYVTLNCVSYDSRIWANQNARKARDWKIAWCLEKSMENEKKKMLEKALDKNKKKGKSFVPYLGIDSNLSLFLLRIDY